VTNRARRAGSDVLGYMRSIRLVDSAATSPTGSRTTPGSYS
jgi:hypothetical protein